MNASIGLRTQLLCISGTVGREIGWNAQWLDDLGVSVMVAGSHGQTAPRSIHARSIPTCSELRRGPEGGMTTFGSSPAMYRISRLCALLPGTMAGTPDSPPR